MSDKAPTLAAVFTEPDQSVKNDSNTDDTNVDQALRARLPGFEWVAGKRELTSKLCEVLDIAVPDVLFQFWEKSDEINAAIADSRESPGEMIDIELVDHDLEGIWKPSIEVKIGRAAELQAFEIPLTIALKCTVEGIKLRIENGAIARILAGVCVLSGEFKLGDLVLARAPRKDQGPLRLEGLELAGH